MTLFHKNNFSYYPRTIWVAILLVFWLAGGLTVSFAQDNKDIPTVKVRKKPGKEKHQKKNNRRESVKDTYKVPRTKSGPEGAKDRYKLPRTRSHSQKVRNNYRRPRSHSNDDKVRDNYRRPRSRSNDDKVRDTYQRPASVANDEEAKMKDARVRKSPSIEEGQDAPQPSLWQRLFNRNNPALAGGGIKVLKPNVRERRQAKQAQEMAGSNGPGSFRRPTQRHQARINKKTSQEVHGFAGNVKVRTTGHQTRYFRKQSEKIHQFNGLMRVRKPQKDMHPSVSYLKSKTKKSYEQKERFRKWKIKWHRFFKDKEQPKHLKTKTRKPRYDKNETEIWYY